MWKIFQRNDDLSDITNLTIHHSYRGEIWQIFQRNMILVRLLPSSILHPITHTEERYERLYGKISLIVMKNMVLWRFCKEHYKTAEWGRWGSLTILYVPPKIQLHQMKTNSATTKIFLNCVCLHGHPAPENSELYWKDDRAQYFHWVWDLITI